MQQGLTGHQGTRLDINYLGKEVLASYAPLDIPGLHWAIVAEMEAQEAFAPLQTLTRRVVLSTVVTILLVSGLALVLGRLFVRPLNRLIGGIRKVDAGHDNVVLEVNSKDEFADLAVAFNVMFRRLKTKTTQLEGKQRAYDRLLARVLPAPARSQAGHTAAAERFDDASVLFAELTGIAELSASMPPRAAFGLLNDLIGAIDDAAERNGVEKLRTVGGCISPPRGCRLRGLITHPASSISRWSFAASSRAFGGYAGSR